MCAMRKASTAERGQAWERHRAELEDKRQDLLSRLGSKFDSIAAMGRVGEEDQAQVSHEEFISLRLNGLDYEKLRQVQEALDRMDAGEYGSCLACEEPISAKRLQAIPWASYCVACQERISELNENPSESIVRLADAVNHW